MNTRKGMEGKKRDIEEVETLYGNTLTEEESHICTHVDAKRARSCSSEDTFTELERLVTDLDFAYSKARRSHNFDSVGEEGTDMNFLVLPWTIDKLDLNLPTSLSSFLETVQ